MYLDQCHTIALIFRPMFSSAQHIYDTRTEPRTGFVLSTLFYTEKESEKKLE